MGNKLKQLSVSCRTCQSLGYADMLVTLRKLGECGRAYGTFLPMYVATGTFVGKVPPMVEGRIHSKKYWFAAKCRLSEEIPISSTLGKCGGSVSYVPPPWGGPSW